MLVREKLYAMKIVELENLPYFPVLASCDLWSALLDIAVATQGKTKSLCTQCESPTHSSVGKDFIANTPHKGWASKAVKGERWYIHRTTDSTMLGFKEIENKITTLERVVWQSFRNVVRGFLRRNYEYLMETYSKHTASLEAGCH